MRIATLLPSATEIVCALGLGDQLVGVSQSCDYPDWVSRLPRLTSTRVPSDVDSESIDAYVRDSLDDHDALYDLDMAALTAARPDVIVSQALCDVCAVATGDVEAAVCGLPGNPTLIDLTPNTLDDVFDDIRRVGDTLNATREANELVTHLAQRRERVAAVSESIEDTNKPRVAFVEWLIPPFNGGHWNPELVRLAGGKNLLGTAGDASTTLSWPMIVDLQPEVLFIACCGFDVQRTLQDVELMQQEPFWNQIPAVRHGRVYVSDGNAFFSCPSPRLIDGLEIMAHAFHPELYAAPANPATVIQP
ncbi:MAG: cobalamin-binding protein [Pseudomonadota bacterium]